MTTPPKLLCPHCFDQKKKEVQLELIIEEKNTWHSQITRASPDGPNQYEYNVGHESVDYMVSFVCPECEIRCYDLGKDTEFDEVTDNIIVPNIDQKEPLGFQRQIYPTHYHTPPYIPVVHERPLPSLKRPSRIKEVVPAYDD